MPRTLFLESEDAVVADVMNGVFSDEAEDVLVDVGMSRDTAVTRALLCEATSSSKVDWWMREILKVQILNTVRKVHVPDQYQVQYVPVVLLLLYYKDE